MRMNRGALVLAVSLVVGTAMAADEADFYLVAQSCSGKVAYLTESDERLKGYDTDAQSLACLRRSDAVVCAISYPGTESPESKVEFRVLLDSPPLLYLMSENGSDFVAIDTVKRTAAMLTRVIHQQFAGSKVCEGIFATSHDVRLLE